MTWFARKPPRREVNALLDYWDDVITQSPATPVPPTPIPAGLGTLVRTLHGAETVNPDHPAYEDRLLEMLLARQKAITTMNVTTLTAVPRPVPWIPPRLTIPKAPITWVRKRAMPAFEITMIVFLVFASAFGIWLAADRGDGPRIVAPGDATPTAEATPDVPMYRGNPERTGVMPGPGIDGQPIELWRAEVEGEIHTAPAIVDGVLYFGAGDGGTYALDLATGEQVWSFAGSSPIQSSPAVANGIVYAGSEDGTLYALNDADGTEAWTFPGARADIAPVVVGNALYTGSDDGYLYALDAATGEEFWRAPLNEAASRSPAVADGVVYIGSADGVLHTFDAVSGEPGWALQLEGANVATTAIANGVVYQNTFGGDANHAYALDAATGEELWRFYTDSGAGFLPPAVGNGLVYLPSDDFSVYAVDATTGAEVWRFETGNNVSAAPALVGDTLYIGGRDQIMYALDAATGAERWRFAVEGEIDFGPVITGGVAYAGTTFGIMYAIGGSGPAGSGVVATPAASATPATPEAPPIVASPESAATPTSHVASPVAAGELATFLWETTGGETPLAQPTDITIAPDGAIWVANGEHAQFDIFAPDGTFIESWGEAGSGDGQFNFVTRDGDAFGALAFAPDGSFYVVDSGNLRVQHFDAERQFLHAWGEFGPGDGEFTDPIDVGVDSQGNVYVDDDQRNDIQKFTADGTHLLTFGGSGSAPGQLDFQGWMTIDASDHVWVADTGNSRIQQFDPDGKFVAEFDGGGILVEPWAVAIDEAGRIYVTDFEAGQVVVLDASGNVIGTWGQGGGGAGALNLPVTITLDGQGNVYVIDVLDDQTWENRLVTYQLQPPLAP